jgi:UDP-N-acetylglucosamine 2-epimerase (non-hydrolysing)
MTLMPTLKIVAIVGTRPEAIKMIPVLRELRARPEFQLTIVSTALHRQMLDQVFGLFDIAPDIDLNVMRPNQSLNDIVHRAVQGIDTVLQSCAPDMLLVQGDTTTAFIAALAAFYRRIEVGHIEAGLRSYHRYNPYPEEINRRLISEVASVHFAPTENSVDNLVREGIGREHIYLTGNTVVDCLVQIAGSGKDTLSQYLPRAFRMNGGRMILVTAHRRENLNGPIKELCEAISCMASMFPKTRFLYPVHMNPKVREVVMPTLSGLPNVALTEPLPYCTFVEAMASAYLILTDSGGVQEEAPSLGKPVLVLRETTERPEGVALGTAKLIGTARHRIVSETLYLLRDHTEYERMAAYRSPYGDGLAAKRTVQGLLHHFGLGERPTSFQAARPKLFVSGRESAGVLKTA